MLAAFIKRLLLLTAVTLLAEAVLPESETGRFAKGVIKLTQLALLTAPTAELLR